MVVRDIEIFKVRMNFEVGGVVTQRLVKPNILACDWMRANGGKSVPVPESTTIKPLEANVERLEMFFSNLINNDNNKQLSYKIEE